MGQAHSTQHAPPPLGAAASLSSHPFIEPSPPPALILHPVLQSARSHATLRKFALHETASLARPSRASELRPHGGNGHAQGPVPLRGGQVSTAAATCRRLPPLGEPLGEPPLHPAAPPPHRFEFDACAQLLAWDCDCEHAPSPACAADASGACALPPRPCLPTPAPPAARPCAQAASAQ